MIQQEALVSLEKIKQKALHDPSLWSLAVSNLLTLIFALIYGWSLLTLMWIYWIQSVIIGFFNFLRILSLKDFSTEGFLINGKPTQPTRSTQVTTAIFFLFQYGFFHLIYMAFLSAGAVTPLAGPQPADMAGVFLAGSIFFANHLFSFYYNKARETEKKNIGSIMFFPYIRIIPMHLTIIFGTLLGNAGMLLFLLLKTFADCAMHIAEHSLFRSGTPASSPVMRD